MKKHTFLWIIFFVSTIGGMAQTRSVQFSYDYAGNRIARAIVLQAAAQSRRANTDNINTEIYTDTFSEYKLHVYPNPTHGELKIELRGLPEGEKYQLLISNASGKIIISRSTSENPTVANLTECPSGIYVMRIQYKDYSKDFKIIRL